MLIEHLPPESATKTAIRASISEKVLDEHADEGRPDLAPWSGTETLLASVKDEVVKLRLALIAVNGGKPGEFQPTPRPGIPPKQKAKPKRLTDEQRRALDPRLRNQPEKEA